MIWGASVHRSGGAPVTRVRSSGFYGLAALRPMTSQMKAVPAMVPSSLFHFGAVAGVGCGKVAMCSGKPPKKPRRPAPAHIPELRS
jgi:hypothetical protein